MIIAGPFWKFHLDKRLEETPDILLIRCHISQLMKIIYSTSVEFYIR